MVIFSLCRSVVLCVALCKFLIFFRYTERHRGGTELHRGSYKLLGVK
jgi:hypothetical protein